MAEIIGVVSGILTITNAIKNALELAKTLYKAPEDILALQYELERFTIVVQDVSRIQGDPKLSAKIPVFDIELSRAHSTITNLQLFINNTLLKEGTPSRRAWASNKRRIKELRIELEKGRSHLLLVLAVANSTLARIVATQVDAIADNVTISQESITTINQTLHTLSFRSSPIEPRVGLPVECSESQAYITSDANDGQQTRGQTQSLPVEPITPFESSSNFIPEKYTICPKIRSLQAFYTIEKSCSEVERVNEYHFWYAETPRKWRNLIVTLTTKTTSTFWSMCQSPRSGSQLIKVPWLPHPVERLLEDKISGLVLSDISYLSCSIEGGDKNVDTTPHFSHFQCLTQEHSTHQFLDYVRDLGCPIFYENEIVSHHFLHANRFVSATPGGRMCIEDKICLCGYNIREAFWETQLLHCLKDSPYVVGLLGVVVDDTCSYVKSYLRALPPSRILLSMLRCAAVAKVSIPLSTRLTWARQIVTAVRDIHAKGFVVGILFEQQGQRMDQHGNVVFAVFKRSIIAAGYMIDGDVAPEQKSSSDGRFEFTSRTDLYQLGSLLWNLVDSHCMGRTLRECMKAGCFKIASPGAEPDLNQIKLPPVNKHVPTWFSRIIDICRSPQPRDRLPASALLAMFPPSTSSHTVEGMLPPEIANHRVPENYYFNSEPPLCHICFTTYPGWKYHCNVCQNGDCDICQSCVESGSHCDDQNHVLGIRRWNGYWYENTGRYHSRAKIQGGKKEHVVSLT